MSVTILRGDCREVLRELPAESVHCVVTSPPYWGLRDYGVAGQIGLEASYLDYIAALADVFAAVWRVLELSGTLWLNLGDCYATGAGKVGECPGGSAQGERWRGGHEDKHRYAKAMGPNTQPNRMPQTGLKPKDLVGIPWRVAFALQEAGWWLRKDIIWHKPNPMPENVSDRPTSCHEHIFLFAKAERYFYDFEAVKEQAISDHPSGNGFKRDARLTFQNSFGEGRGNSMQWQVTEHRNMRDVWTVPVRPFNDAHFATFPPELIEPCIKAGCPKEGTVLDPFGGAGTTGMVADRLGRNAILIELNPDYADMAERRIRNDAPLFAEVGATRSGRADRRCHRSLRHEAERD